MPKAAGRAGSPLPRPLDGRHAHLWHDAGGEVRRAGSTSHRRAATDCSPPSTLPDTWKEIVLEDKSAGRAAVGITKSTSRSGSSGCHVALDKIVVRLLMGDRTCELARRFRLSKGRISQLRRALWESWAEFQGETAEPLWPPLDRPLSYLSHCGRASSVKAPDCASVLRALFLLRCVRCASIRGLEMEPVR
jgi:hypothetical protein